jgi:hypothetical protein
MSRPLNRLLRVRRLMEEMSRAEFAARRAEQTELETRREEARGTALALRGEARAAMSPATAEHDRTPGLWQRYLADSEASSVQVEQWDRVARQAAARADEAERKYMEERRSRRQAEILVREKTAVERLEQERREQREIDDWFGMGRGARLRRVRGER